MAPPGKRFLFHLVAGALQLQRHEGLAEGRPQQPDPKGPKRVPALRQPSFWLAPGRSTKTKAAQGLAFRTELGQKPISQADHRQAEALSPSRHLPGND